MRNVVDYEDSCNIRFDFKDDSMDHDRRLGFALVFISAIVFSTAGLFTKGVNADSWTVIFWRGSFASGFTIIYLLFTRKLSREIRTFGQSAVLAAIIGAFATAAFIASFKFTSIANVALIYGTAPVFAGILGWIILRQVPSRLLLVAAMCSLLGVLILVSGSLDNANLKGDFLAVLMVIGMSLMLVVYRKFPDTPTGTSVIASSILLICVTPVFTDPLDAPFDEIATMASFGLIFAIGSVTMVEGAVRLLPAETALIGGVEAPLAPIWAYMLLSEVPPVNTWIGGIIILLSIGGWQVVTLRKEVKPDWEQTR